MSRFLNKKEEVIDLKLTSYGKYLLSIGSFKPVYYAFYDDNVLYDSQYAERTETQNEARKRIKEDTQYLEGLVLFEDLEKKVMRKDESELNYFQIDITPTKEVPRKDVFRFDQALGDAFLQGETQQAPAWKVVALQAAISSSTFFDVRNNTRVPQVNISASYQLKTMAFSDYQSANFNSTDPRKHTLVTPEFADGKVIYLETQDPLIYVEEANTELLVKNYDVEVFEILDTTETVDTLRRIYFDQEKPQIVDGFMVSPNAPQQPNESDNNPIEYGDGFSTVEFIPTGSVAYYWDFLKDTQIDRKVACKAASRFNKESYYVDLDFDCDLTKEEDLFFDIYGQATEPEICQD